MNKLIILFSISIAFVAGFYFFISKSNEKKSAQNFQRHCGSCHVAPNPDDLTREIWRAHVLPEMGARLGMKTEGFDPVKNMSFQEREVLLKNNIYPSRPAMGEKDWEKLKRYIISQAPVEIKYDKRRKDRNLPLKQFRPHVITVDDKKGAFITCLSYQEDTHTVFIGDVYGNVYEMTAGQMPTKTASIMSPVVSVIKRDTFHLVTGIGKMPPTDLQTGKLYTSHKNGIVKLFADNLQRPVFAEMWDLNKNGVEEIIVCEFGNKAGQLSLFHKEKNEADFKKTTLLSVAGTIRLVVEDMDHDGLDDLVVLQAQGDEGITILFQQDDHSFTPEKVISLNPVFGSNWFELVDYDGDGDKDIVLVNGDNADYSFMAKPYHGVRIFINSGNNQFEEKFFYPVYGATGIAAGDFDEDGDVDLAISAYFADYEENPNESFVYLENKESENFVFETYTFEGSISGRWRVMEKGDVDGDGDLDILLGSFIPSPTPIPEKFMVKWSEENVDLIFLENLEK